MGRPFVYGVQGAGLGSPLCQESSRTCRTSVAEHRELVDCLSGNPTSLVPCWLTTNSSCPELAVQVSFEPHHHLAWYFITSPFHIGEVFPYTDSNPVDVAGGAGSRLTRTTPLR